MPLPLTVSCFSKIQIGFTFLVPAHPGGVCSNKTESVWENVHMITDLPTKGIYVLSQWQTFLEDFTYKMAAKINWHRYGTTLRHCQPTYNWVDWVSSVHVTWTKLYVSEQIAKTGLAMLLVKKAKFSHTRYRALGPELIPAYRQSARRWREVNHAIDLAVGCRYFLPGLRLPP